MIIMKGSEYRADPAGAHALMREREESLQIVDDKTGKPRMTISFYKLPPPCTCASDIRQWVCMTCDGAVPSPGTQEKP